MLSRMREVLCWGFATMPVFLFTKHFLDYCKRNLMISISHRTLVHWKFITRGTLVKSFSKLISIIGDNSENSKLTVKKFKRVSWYLLICIDRFLVFWT